VDSLVGCKADHSLNSSLAPVRVTTNGGFFLCALILLAYPTWTDAAPGGSVVTMRVPLRVVKLRPSTQPASSTECPGARITINRGWTAKEGVWRVRRCVY